MREGEVGMIGDGMIQINNFLSKCSPIYALVLFLLCCRTRDSRLDSTNPATRLLETLRKRKGNKTGDAKRGKVEEKIPLQLSAGKEQK